MANRDNDLGSLSQSARRSSLKQARVILILIGVLTLLANGFLAMTAEKRVDDELDKIQRNMQPGMVVDHAKLKDIRGTLVTAETITNGLFAGVGLIFIVLGILVYKAPVVCTVLGLVLYLGGWLVTVVFAVLGGDGADVGKVLMSGILIKVLIIVGLCKAIQAATAYQAEAKAMPSASESY